MIDQLGATAGIPARQAFRQMDYVATFNLGPSNRIETKEIVTDSLTYFVLTSISAVYSGPAEKSPWLTIKDITHERSLAGGPAGLSPAESVAAAFGPGRANVLTEPKGILLYMDVRGIFDITAVLDDADTAARQVSVILTGWSIDEGAF